MRGCGHNEKADGTSRAGTSDSKMDAIPDVTGTGTSRRLEQEPSRARDKARRASQTRAKVGPGAKRKRSLEADGGRGGAAQKRSLEAVRSPLTLV